MKNNIILLLITLVLTGCTPAIAQSESLNNPKTSVVKNISFDIGYIVIEESILNKRHKQLVYVVGQDIVSPSEIEYQTYSLIEGYVHIHNKLVFPKGLAKGQALQLWNGDFNNFQTTPWLYFQITLKVGLGQYNLSSLVPINQSEMYKEPMITAIAYDWPTTYAGVLSVSAIYDSTEPFTVLIDQNIFIPQELIFEKNAGMFKIRMAGIDPKKLEEGKHLLTLCQMSACDTLEFRHR